MTSDIIEYHIRLLLCYVKVLGFSFVIRPSDLIPTLTYVLMKIFVLVYLQCNNGISFISVPYIDIYRIWKCKIGVQNYITYLHIFTKIDYMNFYCFWNTLSILNSIQHILNNSLMLLKTLISNSKTDKNV